MESLEKLKETLQQEYNALDGEYVEQPASLGDYRKFLKAIGQHFKKQATPEEKARIVRALVSKIEVFSDRVTVYYKVGQDTLNVGESASVGTKKSPWCIAARWA